jgi:hypothetical protein
MSRTYQDRTYPDVEIIPPRARPSGDAGPRAALERLDNMARLLDTAIAIPGTGIRFGADSVIGLVPGIGDLITTAMSAYIVYEAQRLGAPKHVIARMVGNIAVDGLIGAIPLVGDLFDVAWRANRRNVKLLRDHLERKGVTSRLA